MSDRKPKVGEVWTNSQGEPWECLKEIGPDDYVWFAFGRSAMRANARYLTPPTSPPPAWLAEECWVLIKRGGAPKIAEYLYAEHEIGDPDYDGATDNAAKVKVDPSTFEWLDGR